MNKMLLDLSSCWQTYSSMAFDGQSSVEWFISLKFSAYSKTANNSEEVRGFVVGLSLRVIG